MKYLIYWAIYSSSLNEGNLPIAGTIVITDSTITSYIWPYQYIEWDIVESHETNVGDYLQSANYFLERNHIRSMVVITTTQIYHYVATEPAIHIYYHRRKSPGRKHHKRKQ